MKQTRLNIITKTEKYPIIIGSNLTSSISKIFKSNSIGFDKCLIVVDKNVPKKFVSNIKRSFKFQILKGLLKIKVFLCYFLMLVKKTKILIALIKF